MRYSNFEAKKGQDLVYLQGKRYEVFQVEGKKEAIIGMKWGKKT